MNTISPVKGWDIGHGPLWVGAIVTFPRGMFGPWEGRILRFYRSRQEETKGEPWAVIEFTRTDGSKGRARLPVGSLRHG